MIVAGVADSAAVGSGGAAGDTLTASESAPLPVLLVQVSTNVAFAAGERTSLPATDLAPLQSPEAAQPLALVVVQAKVTVAPATIAPGVAVKATVGIDCGVGEGVVTAIASESDPLPALFVQDST